jgi:hypothetical protein
MTRLLILAAMILLTAYFLTSPTAMADPETMKHGLSSLSAGHYAEALKDFVKVAKADPKDEQARYCAAVCYHFLSRYPEATTQYDWVCTNGKDPDLVRRAKKGLAAVGKLAAKPAVPLPTSTSGTGIDNAAAQPPNSATAKPAEPEAELIDCPGPCLKRSMPGWAKHPELNYGPDLEFMGFPFAGGTQYYSTYHIGEVIENDAEGHPKTTGKCKICGGTGKVPRK